MQKTFVSLAALIAATSCATPAAQVGSSPSPTLVPSDAVGTAVLHDATGREVGTVTLSDTYAGVLLVGSLSHLPAGTHAIHVHAVGKCEPPFTTAGGHANPMAKQHGFLNPQGHHAGDAPNIEVNASGEAKFELLLPGASLTGASGFLDADGAAVVVHGGRDDYKSDPAGNAGARIACGVLTRARSVGM